MNKNEQLLFSDITRESPKFLKPTYFLKSDQNLESRMKGLLGYFNICRSVIKLGTDCSVKNYTLPNMLII